MFAVEEVLMLCRQVLSTESGMDMDMDVGPIQRLVGHLSKQDLCKYPTKIGGRGRMDVRIALLLDHRIIGIMSGTKADHLKDLLLRAILAT